MRLDRDFYKSKNGNHSQVKPSKGFEGVGQWFFEEKSKISWKNAVIRKKREKTVMNSIDIRGTIAMSLRNEVVTTARNSFSSFRSDCNEPQRWGSYD